MNKPIRVQLRRTKGWRLPPNTMVVARPRAFGNPFFISPHPAIAYWLVEGPRFSGGPSIRCRCDTKANAQLLAVDLYRIWILSEAVDLAPLRGKSLACWCALNAPCHADALLELANAEISPAQQMGVVK